MGISPSPRPSHTHTPYDTHKAEKGDGRWAHAYTRVPVVRSEDNVDKGHGAGQGESTRLWSGPRTTLTRDNVSYELTVTVSCVSRTSSRMFTFTRHMRSPPKPVSAGPVSPSHASLERAFPSETPESCAIAQQPGVSAHVRSCCVRSRDCYSNSRRRGGDIPYALHRLLVGAESLQG